YPIERVTGTLDSVLTSDGYLETKIDVHGMTGERPVHLHGTITGDKHAPEIKLELWGDNIPLDQKLLAALDGNNRKLALSFLPDKSRKPSPEFQPMRSEEHTS